MGSLVIIEKDEVPCQPKVPKTDEDLCIGCGVCVKVCPVKDINELVKEPVLDGVVSIIAEIPKDKENTRVVIEEGKTCSLAEFCITCCRCVQECPADARSF